MSHQSKSKIASIDHFSELSGAQLDYLIGGSEVIDYPQGSTILDPNQRQAIYSFLLSGKWWMQRGIVGVDTPREWIDDRPGNWHGGIALIDKIAPPRSRRDRLHRPPCTARPARRPRRIQPASRSGDAARPQRRFHHALQSHPRIKPMNTYTLLSALAAGTVMLSVPAQAQDLPSTRIFQSEKTIEERLQVLIDREEIAQIVVSLGHSYDTKDWELHRSLFADDIQMDFSASIGDGLVTMRADEWVAAVRPFFEALDATQHVGMPLSTRIDGDRAEVTAMLHAQHFLDSARGEPVQRMVGSYDISLERQDGVWKIVKIVQHIDWNEGNWHVFELAAGIVEK